MLKQPFLAFNKGDDNTLLTFAAQNPDFLRQNFHRICTRASVRWFEGISSSPDPTTVWFRYSSLASLIQTESFLEKS